MFHISFPGGSVVKNPPTKLETQVRSLSWEDPLEKEMATQSSTLVWKIPWTRILVGYSPWGRKDMGHDWSNSAQLLQITTLITQM